MERTNVSSSIIHSIGYDTDTEILEIQFTHSTKLYRYKGVPEYVYDELIAASSHGSYWKQHCKEVSYETEIVYL